MHEVQKLAAYPHSPTPPGAVVELQGYGGPFTVLSHFVAYQDGRKRMAYILRDPAGELCLSLNGWHSPFGYLSERLAQLQAAARELEELREALRQAVGEN